MGRLIAGLSAISSSTDISANVAASRISMALGVGTITK